MSEIPDENRRLRVLVVDDRPDNSEALCVLLEVLGCVTAVASSGSEGIALAATFDPHLAFIDLEMPGMGGCEVVRQLRADHPTSTARHICLTGRGQPEDRRTCMDAGFHDFFTKPMAPANLARVIEEMAALSGTRVRLEDLTGVAR